MLAVGAVRKRGGVNVSRPFLGHCVFDIVSYSSPTRLLPVSYLSPTCLLLVSFVTGLGGVVCLFSSGVPIFHVIGTYESFVSFSLAN